jgi:hypothetical protein
VLGGKRSVHVRIRDRASPLVSSAGFADGGVQVRPRLRLVLGLEEMADGPKPVPVAACRRSIGSVGLPSGQEGGRMAKLTGFSRDTVEGAFAGIADGG